MLALLCQGSIGEAQGRVQAVDRAGGRKMLAGKTHRLRGRMEYGEISEFVVSY